MRALDRLSPMRLGFDSILDITCGLSVNPLPPSHPLPEDSGFSFSPKVKNLIWCVVIQFDLQSPQLVVYIKT